MLIIPAETTCATCGHPYATHTQLEDATDCLVVTCPCEKFVEEACPSTSM